MPECGRCSHCRLECLGLGKQSLKGSEQSCKRGSLFFCQRSAVICQPHCTDL